MQVTIVGNSAAALSALESFRERDRTASVTLVSAEPGPAYSRVLLPYYLRRRLSRDGVFIRQMSDYARLHAATEFGARVERVDPARRELQLADGRRLGFDRLLLATGSSPARPPIPGLEGPGIHTLWTLDDATRLDPLFREGARVMVLGSGFVALQAAWAARQRGLQVTVVELLDQILPRVLDAAAARILHEQLLAHGVDVRTGTRTDGLETDRRRHGARLDRRRATRSRSTPSSWRPARAPTTDCCRSVSSRASRASRSPTPWRPAWTASSPPET